MISGHNEIWEQIWEKGEIPKEWKINIVISLQERGSREFRKLKGYTLVYSIKCTLKF